MVILYNIFIYHKIKYISQCITFSITIFDIFVLKKVYFSSTVRERHEVEISNEDWKLVFGTQGGAIV